MFVCIWSTICYWIKFVIRKWLCQLCPFSFCFLPTNPTLRTYSRTQWRRSVVCVSAGGGELIYARNDVWNVKHGLNLDWTRWLYTIVKPFFCAMANKVQSGKSSHFNTFTQTARRVSLSWSALIGFTVCLYAIKLVWHIYPPPPPFASVIVTHVLFMAICYTNRWQPQVPVKSNSAHFDSYGSEAVMMMVMSESFGLFFCFCFSMA